MGTFWCVGKGANKWFSDIQMENYDILISLLTDYLKIVSRTSVALLSINEWKKNGGGGILSPRIPASLELSTNLLLLNTF